MRSRSEDLRIEFCGEVTVVFPPERFSFGRAGDLVVDENPYLHRLVGVFEHRNGWWWLQNVGRHHPLELQSRLAGTSMNISPGNSVPLVFGPSAIRFRAGATSYEIDIDASMPNSADLPELSLEGNTTIDAGDIPLSPEQLLLLVALAEPRLRRGSGASIPTNAEVCARFGWSTTKFNRKLDSICVKFARRGVGGLVGNSDRLATARRTVLIDYVIGSGMVTIEQLALLDEQGTTPSSASTPKALGSKQWSS